MDDSLFHREEVWRKVWVVALAEHFLALFPPPHLLYEGKSYSLDIMERMCQVQDYNYYIRYSDANATRIKRMGG